MRDGRCSMFDLLKGRSAFLVIGRIVAGFRPPRGGRVTFFACPKKVTKEKTPRRSRPAGILPLGCACGGRVRSRAHPCARDRIGGIRAAARGCAATTPPTTRRSQRGPVEAAAILAAEAKTAARAKISSSRDRNHIRHRIRVGAGLAPLGGRQAAEFARTCASGASPASTGREFDSSSDEGSARRCRMLRVGGRAGCALLLWGPLRPGETGPDQPAGTRTRMSAYSSRHRMCCRRIPASAHAPAGQDVRRTGRSGCPFFRLPFFGHAKKANSAAAEADDISRPNNQAGKAERPQQGSQPASQPATATEEKRVETTHSIPR